MTIAIITTVQQASQDSKPATRIESWDHERISGFVNDQCVLLATKGTLWRGRMAGGMKVSWSLFDYVAKRDIYTRPGMSKAEVMRLLKKHLTKLVEKT